VNCSSSSTSAASAGALPHPDPFQNASLFCGVNVRTPFLVEVQHQQLAHTPLWSSAQSCEVRPSARVQQLGGKRDRPRLCGHSVELGDDRCRDRVAVEFACAASNAASPIAPRGGLLRVRHRRSPSQLGAVRWPWLSLFAASAQAIGLPRRFVLTSCCVPQCGHGRRSVPRAR
jgi:hypothetical protein